jgi:hypothetical protein
MRAGAIGVAGCAAAGDEAANETADPMEAFLRTAYTAHLPREGTIAIRVGQANAALEALLAAHGADGWAYITAWNPGARRLSAVENAQRHRALVDLLQRMGCTFFEGEGVPDEPGWEPERSVLVIGIGEDEARAIGRRFGQLAIVCGRRGQLPRLLACTD